MPLTMRAQTPPSTKPLYMLGMSQVLVTTEATPEEIGTARLEGTQITVSSVETGKTWRVAAHRIIPLD